MPLTDKELGALTEHQSKLLQALATARLDQIQTLQGKWAGLEEAKQILLSLAKEADDDDDA